MLRAALSYPPPRPPMNCSAMPTPQAHPAVHEARRPCQSRAYSMNEDSSHSMRGWYSSDRFQPQARKKKETVMKKKAL